MYPSGSVLLVNLRRIVLRINEPNISYGAKPIEYYIDSNGCWICTSHKPWSTGYSVVRRNEKRTTTHKYVYELLVGKMSDGFHGLHKCDVRLCINPDHVFPGTNLDNIKDKMSKGRHRTVYGEDSSLAKLEEEDVHEIRYLHSIGYSQKFLADGYGVLPGNISRIVNRKRWKHIKEDCWSQK